MDSTLIINLAIGLVAGVLAGMFGIGGGVVIVPALILFSHFPITEANGTSLAALLLPVGIFAVISYYKAGLLKISISMLVAVGLALGVSFGSMIALSISMNLLKILYGIFLLYVSWTFLKPPEIYRKYIRKIDITPEKKEEKEAGHYPFYFFIIVGFCAGILSGMFGIGGGLVIVPVLVAFMHYDTKKAVGTSLGALMLPVGLPGVLLYYNAGQLNIGYAVPVAVGIVFGAVAGAKITISMSNNLVKQVYGIFLVIMGTHFIIQGL